VTRGKTNARSGTKAEREFVSEAEEILEAMRSDVADLSDAALEGADLDPDLVNRLFRSAHSLKALAGMFRFAPIEELAHRLEDVLDAMRLGRIGAITPVLALIEESAEMFAALLEGVGDADALASFEGAIGQLVARIEAAAEAQPPSRDAFDGLTIDPSLLGALTEYEEHRLRENLERGRNIVLVNTMFEIIAFEEGLSELTSAIREHGEVLSTLPAPGEAPESQIHFTILSATDLDAPELLRAIDFPGATVESVGSAAPVRRSRSGSPAPVVAAPAGEAVSRLEDGSGVMDLHSLKSISDTVRVDIRKLDELMNLVGELVIQRGALGEQVMRLVERRETAKIGSELGKVHKAIDRKLRDLQSAVLDVRMVPLRQVFEKISRVVRRMKRDLEKDVELEIRGADTELDKLIVEALVDPLMHVVRNALDHALESETERSAAGKPARGVLALEAFQRGNHVVIAVRDDGRGIDPIALRARAEAQGLVRPGETLSDRETLDLIFEPGISTREEVTETSGRGVGMDVVRSNLTALGGIVGVESIPGRGTTISLTVPITLAIIQSLLVGVGGRRFAVPLNSVLETLMIDWRDIQNSEDREILNLRGEPLLLRRLAREFDLPETAATEKPFVIVMGIGDQRAGLIVDALHGQQDTVIKAIQGPIESVRGIAGATDLGDQDPVLVLDVSAIVEDAGRRRESS
jgi:two-component system chemotaxis sensor kinase CheA